MKKVLVLGFLILAGSLLVYAGEPDFHTESGFGIFSGSFLPLLSISLGSDDPLLLSTDLEQVSFLGGQTHDSIAATIPSLPSIRQDSSDAANIGVYFDRSCLYDFQTLTPEHYHCLDGEVNLWVVISSGL